MTSTDFDAIVIGARCAGAATARLMALSGLRVLAVDAAERGSDTLSSHILTRGAVMQLDRWGLLSRVQAAGAPHIPETVFDFGGEVMRIGLGDPGALPGILTPRRTILDATLVQAAEEAGVDCRFRTSLVDLLRDDHGRITGARLQTAGGSAYDVSGGLVVGADGLRSGVARRVGAQAVASAPRFLGHVYGYVSGLHDPANRGYFGPGLSLAVTPTTGGLHCVMISTDPALLRQLLRSHGPDGAIRALAGRLGGDLADELAGAQFAESPRVFAGASGVARQCVGSGWALVGDSGYFRDPVTSHGITDAFRDAELLARAAAGGTAQAFASYQADRDSVVAEIFALTGRIVRVHSDLPLLRGGFRDLSQAMRREQEWMTARFAPRARAAA